MEVIMKNTSGGQIEAWTSSLKRKPQEVSKRTPWQKKEHGVFKDLKGGQ